MLFNDNNMMDEEKARNYQNYEYLIGLAEDDTARCHQGTS